MVDWRKYWNESIETISRQDLRRVQFKRLNKQLNNIYHNSSYYRGIMRKIGISPEDIKSLEDFTKFPVTYKDSVRELISAGDPFGGLLCIPFEDIKSIYSTTGTTGIPSIHAMTKENQEYAAEQTARLTWMQGFRPGDVLFWPPVRWNGFIFGVTPGLERIGVVSITNILYPLPNYADKMVYALKHLHPDVMAAPIVIFDGFLEACKRVGEKPAEVCESLRTISIGYGDVLTNSYRQKLIKEAELEPEKIFSGGGAADTMIHLAECEVREGTHICEDLYLAEILDLDTKEPVGENERGELILSNLYMRGTPLIRWGSEDISTFSRETCKCGRTHGRATWIGRTGFQLNIMGKWILPLDVDDLFIDVPEAAGVPFTLFKYKKDVMEKLKMKMVYDGSKGLTKEEFREKVSGIIKEKLGVETDIEIVDSIDDLPKIAHKYKRVEDLTKES